MKSYADDYTQFDSETPTRLDGRAVGLRLTEAAVKDSGTDLITEMLNPKVQTYGDVSILTYNYVHLGQDKDGKVKTDTGKSSRVYVKQAGKWMLVHGHFTADPPPRQ
jgi:ketosteroid isomerase-like protein